MERILLDANGVTEPDCSHHSIWPCAVLHTLSHCNKVRTRLGLALGVRSLRIALQQGSGRRWKGAACNPKVALQQGEGKRRRGMGGAKTKQKSIELQWRQSVHLLRHLHTYHQ